MKLIDKILYTVFLSIGKRYYDHINIYAPSGKVRAITFAIDEDYIYKIGEIE